MLVTFNIGIAIPYNVTKINILSPISRCQHTCSLILTGGKILIFEIQSELVKSSKLDLNFGSNLTKSLKSREDFRNKGFIMFRNSPATDYPDPVGVGSKSDHASDLSIL